MQAFMLFAISVMKHRKGEEKAAATEFLQWVSPFRWILLAMLADAGDEAILLLRVFDDEKADSRRLWCLNDLQSPV